MIDPAYELIPIRESDDPLVLLKEDDFVLGHMYYLAGLSPIKEMYLRKTVIEKLLKIQKKLKTYRFKIWDGYRPREVQKNVYQKYWKELEVEHPDWNKEQLTHATSTYVSIPDKPTRIPPHATGGTIDLTLVDEKGKEVDMGTGFDFFGPEAAPYYFDEHDLNQEVKNHRKLFREAMFEEEFTINREEWWHFDYGNQVWAFEKKKPFAIFGEAQI